MKVLGTRSRITLGLTCLLVSVLCAAMLIGLVPDRNGVVLAGRADLCEAIAVSSSDYISRGELSRLRHFLESIVARNSDLQSIGVRPETGELLCEVGDHASHWRPDAERRSSDWQVYVPIRSGQDKWGCVELRFLPLATPGWRGYLTSVWARLTVFVALSCFVLYYLYLGRMLEYLNPSKTVPSRVRAALDSLAEGLLVIDDSQRIVLANQAFSDWIGRTPEQMTGVHAHRLDWVKSEAGEPLETYPWVEAVRLAAPQVGVSLSLRRDGYPQRVLIANASPVLGPDGKYRGVLVSFDDVTQLEHTRRDLDNAKQAAEASRRLAEEANHAKSEFLARMSHEIRTPMNAILGYTDVLRRGFDETVEDRQEYLDTIHGSGEHLLALINDILDLSKIEAGNLELERSRCSPISLLSQVGSLLRAKAAEKGIELAVEFAGPVPETILTDAVRLRQTIVNLVGNAIKFTDQGGVRIVARLVTARPATADAPLFAIAVSDSGIGIPDDVQRKIFEPFAQADSTITRRFGGTGLGLAISRQLAEALGGGISVHSVPGQGSTFTLTIDPGSLVGIRMVEGEDVRAVAVPRTIAPAELLQLPPARILVADDGQTNRDLMELVLTRAGTDVVKVENGQLAVERALREQFDVILMDMQMPVLDGYAAAEALRKSGYTRPIIALTAHAMRGVEEKCRAAGCSGFLTKPIKINRLLETLTQVLADQGRCLAPTDGAETQRRPLPEATRGYDPSVKQSAGKGAVECSYPLDDPEYLEIAQSFVARLETQLAAMRAACARNDDVELAALAHWLTGSGGTAGFDAFTQPARELDLAARSRQRHRYRSLIRRLDDLAARIEVQVNT